PELPAGFVGSAVVEGPPGSSIAAVVTELNRGGNGASYEAALEGSPVISAPLLFKNSNGWNTGIQVLNVADTPADVLVTYFASDGGGPWLDRATVAPGAATTFTSPPTRTCRTASSAPPSSTPWATS